MSSQRSCVCVCIPTYPTFSLYLPSQLTYLPTYPTTKTTKQVHVHAGHAPLGGGAGRPAGRQKESQDRDGNRQQLLSHPCVVVLVGNNHCSQSLGGGRSN